MTYQVDGDILHELGCTTEELRTLLETTPGGEEKKPKGKEQLKNPVLEVLSCFPLFCCFFNLPFFFPHPFSSFFFSPSPLYTPTALSPAPEPHRHDFGNISVDSIFRTRG